MNLQENIRKHNLLKQSRIASGINLEKAKYFKREGTPGNYKYYYTEEGYKKSRGGEKEGSKDIPTRKDQFDVRAGDTVGNTVSGFNFELLGISSGTHPLEVKDKRSGKIFNTTRENMYLSSSDFKKEEAKEKVGGEAKRTSKYKPHEIGEDENDDRFKDSPLSEVQTASITQVGTPNQRVAEQEMLRRAFKKLGRPATSLSEAIDVLEEKK